MVRKKIGTIIITLILLIVSVFLLVFFGNKVKTQTLEYEEVEVTVISAEKVRHNGNSRNNVIVEYEGGLYELHGIKDLEMAGYERAADAQEDTTVKVYLYNRQLYSNESSIKTNNSAFNWRQAGLLGTYIFGIWHLICVADLIDKKVKLRKKAKKEAGIYRRIKERSPQCTPQNSAMSNTNPITT